MKEKRNDLWKLDFLEAKYTQVTPRFSFTKKLISAKNNSQIMKKLPSTPNEAFKQIHALKTDLFRKKFYGSYKKLSREVSRVVKQKSKGKTESEYVNSFMQKASFHEELINAKLVKIISTAILNTKELRASPPTYIPEEVRKYILDKSVEKNPSRFFITYCQNDKVLNGYISQLWNSKEMKTLCSEIDWTFRKIRGNLTEAETTLRTKETGKNAKEEEADDSDSDSVSDSDSDSDSDSESESGKSELDAEEAFDKFSAYDNLVAGSDEEGDFVADPNIDYNDITDQEMSVDDSDSGSESESSVKPKKSSISESSPAPKKVVLPQLASGYYSGGSDDEEDIDNDKVVKAATTTRKNRRGQRARQKIWEQKFGHKANHVQKERVRISSEREQKQQEFEERQRKREEKAKLAQEKNTSKTAGSVSVAGESSKVHPSWEAKKLAEEKMKNVKFEGKKITFD